MTATAGASPTVWTIAPGRPFVDDLAAELLRRHGGDLLALSRVTVLLPTRRACRSLREAFLRAAADRPLTPPRMEPIGDIDAEALSVTVQDLPGLADRLDLPDAVSGARRQLLLAKLILARGDLGLTVEQALWLAADLARLIDEVHTHRLDFDRLHDLVPDALARHWQDTLRFLEIVTAFWPAVLADEGMIDPAARRNLVLNAQAEAWQRRPPNHPVIAAGSTGSIPATADLLAVVARLPRGEVVLPGLDRDMDEESWAALDDPHPQFGLKRLIEKIGVARSTVRDWPGPPADDPAPDRSALVREAMRPAATTDAWRRSGPVVGSPTGGKPLGAAALDGLSRIDAPTAREEAAAIALVMRHALETPGRTVALVTPDRGLARRVAAAMDRWGVQVDDSAGRSLADTPVGSYLRQTAVAAAERFAPVALLSLLKHPLASGGEPTPAFRAHVRALERAALRGPRPAPGLAGVVDALRRASVDRFARPRDRDRLIALAARLQDLARPFVERLSGPPPPLPDLLRDHIAFAEALAADDETTGADRLWRRDDGEAAAELINELASAAQDFPNVDGSAYPGLFDALIAGRMVRPRYGDHPRAMIWGPLEARLQCPDLVVLGGLNEGTWPATPPVDPWLSRPMRADFGLPPPERRIGLSAHDFAQAFSGPAVVLTRAQRVDGAPTVPSRWLLRLDAVLAGAGLALSGPSQWGGWAAALDAPDAVSPVPPPAPRPPVAARPRRLSVTEIGTWMVDPYAIYARHVLRLAPLDPLEADPGAAERGSAIHGALARFVAATAEYEDDLPADAEDRLLALGRDAFAELAASPSVVSLWWPRFERLAGWIVEAERTYRSMARPLVQEVPGQVVMDVAGRPFTLIARADRIDRFADGGLSIVDYKTGQVPAESVVALGYAPQLPLEAMIAAAGGFAGVDAAPVRALAHWRLTGGTPPGEIRQTGGGPSALDALVADAADGLRRLVARFDDPATPYRSRPRADAGPRFSDYDHLARVAEWSAGAGEAG